jgi:Ni,Fe-hydrogenase III small subunit/formate hydrogenlyase subunit 6/NADH:ubiquinone oxidoreductase subunit I
MLDLLRTRLKQGTRTSGFPKEAPEFPERFRGRPAFDASRCEDGCRECARSVPSAFIQLRATATVDVGACLFSPEEATACPHGAVSFTRDFRMASATRQGLCSTTGEVELARALDARSRHLFGRSLRLRSVAAGSCNGCESELVALGNVVFDLARFGVQFVASPRHADGIVISGAVSANMSAALRATYDAVPDPRLVIAVGACAINGGPFRGSPEVGDGVPGDLPVDLWVPGCPPHPLTVLDGVLRLLGRIEEDSAGSRAGIGALGR